jgi:Transcriptional regulator, AbiEi antitoxin N-terminal domain
MQARGVSAFRALALARSGWLIHLGRDAYMLPGDTLTRDGCLAYLSQRVPGLPWAALVKRHSQRLGGGKRWIAVAKTGERLDLRRS